MNDIDSGVTGIQIKNNGANLGAVCNFAAAAATARTCTASIAAGTGVGAQSITAVAVDGLGAFATATAVVVTIEPAALTCTLSANPVSPLAGMTTTLTTNCTSGGVPIQGAAIAWNTSCLPGTSTTDVSGSATCTTPLVSASTLFTATPSLANYTAPVASVTVNPIHNLAPKIASITLITTNIRVGSAVTMRMRANDDGTIANVSAAVAFSGTTIASTPTCTPLGAATLSCDVVFTPPCPWPWATAGF